MEKKDHHVEFPLKRLVVLVALACLVLIVVTVWLLHKTTISRSEILVDNPDAGGVISIEVDDSNSGFYWLQSGSSASAGNGSDGAYGEGYVDSIKPMNIFRIGGQVCDMRRFGARVFVGSQGGSVLIKNGRLFEPLIRIGPSVSAIHYDGNMMIIGDSEGFLHEFDLGRGLLVRTLKQHDEWITGTL